MNESTDYFAWARTLECPPTFYTDSVKKILCKGVIEQLWDNISRSAFPVSEVNVIRKNILLHKLKHGQADNVIQCVMDRRKLKMEREKLTTRIAKLEEQYEQQDFLTRQKVNHLRKISSTHSLLKTKRDLLGTKHAQTCTQLRDCESMRLVCQRLMPKTSENVDQEKIREVLRLVTGLCVGAKKKEVWDEISNVLGNVEISRLWANMYQCLSVDVQRLINLAATKVADATVIDGENIDIGIARMCGQHICSVSKRLLASSRAKQLQESVMQLIEQIDDSSSSCPDVSDWLALKLEICKLEVEHGSLQKEVDKLKETVQEKSSLVSDFALLTSNIESIDVEIRQYTDNIQQSLTLLKSTSMLIIKIKEKLRHELGKVVLVKAENYDDKWLINQLYTELDIFYDSFDINALRKILLKGEIGIHRHTQCCLSEASVATSDLQNFELMPYFPMIQIPVYSLIDYYKNIAVMLAYKSVSLMPIRNTDLSAVPCFLQEKHNYNTMDLLNFTKATCIRGDKEVVQFNKMLEAWINQSVQQAMDLQETRINNASFRDWQHRYSLILYMIQNCK
ncbi:hypothetical protein KM043_001441 [Ampulex compressa]|nr:hypothetical protein KM043_001441 [Ampulex compressa]